MKQIIGLIMDINKLLIKFASQELILAKSSTERDRINNSLNVLESKIKSGLSYEINRFLRFGSYTRNTILPRRYDSNSDVDLMVIMKVANGRLMSPNTYRTNIQQVLQRTYPNSLSGKDFPAVKLELNHIMFDIVPAYIEADWFGTQRYYIPDKGSGWMETFPNDINNKLSELNQAHGNNTIRNVIRLCKHWNSSAKYPLESYLMEKQILSYADWYTGNTFEMFLKIMRKIAGHRAGVKQALDKIEEYNGGWFQDANTAKQFQWLCKLLPGLQYCK